MLWPTQKDNFALDSPRRLAHQSEPTLLPAEVDGKTTVANLHSTDFAQHPVDDKHPV